MTSYELKDRHMRTHPASHYFDRETLKFFGERLSEMRVLKTIFTVEDSEGNTHQAYCLSSLQRNYPSGPKRHYAFFDKETYDIVRS